jgi:hypothetical protein
MEKGASIGSNEDMFGLSLPDIPEEGLEPTGSSGALEPR